MKLIGFGWLDLQVGGGVGGVRLRNRFANTCEIHFCEIMQYSMLYNYHL